METYFLQSRQGSCNFYYRLGIEGLLHQFGIQGFALELNNIKKMYKLRLE